MVHLQEVHLDPSRIPGNVQRVCHAREFSVAMVAMVNRTKSSSLNASFQVTECLNLVHYEEKQTTKALKESSITGIRELKEFGAKWLFGGGTFITAVFSLLTPLAARLGTAAFITVRVLEGLGEGVTFPAINFLISQWAPRIERSRISTIIFTGSHIGNFVSMPISGWLSGSDVLGGWPSVFYVF
ncbi:hypothetical protein CEXT_640401, partial [Caerostris extrusa]